MGKSNLRQTQDAFADNVKERIPTTLVFDGVRLHLTTVENKGKVGMTDDLTDDTCYRLTGDDIDTVAEEMGADLRWAERVHVQKGIEAGFGSSWHDIVESAIQDVLGSRRES
jgi:hypothetical protein